MSSQIVRDQTKCRERRPGGRWCSVRRSGMAASVTTRRPFRRGPRFKRSLYCPIRNPSQSVANRDSKRTRSAVSSDPRPVGNLRGVFFLCDTCDGDITLLNPEENEVVSPVTDPACTRMTGGRRGCMSC
jgi:hypothetical protein